MEQHELVREDDAGAVLLPHGEVRTAIEAGQGFIVAIAGAGETAAAVAGAIAGALSDPAIRLVRIANPLSSSLTISRMCLQIATADGETEDEVARIVHALAKRQGPEDHVVLLVEDAETLNRQALLFLHSLPAIALPGGPALHAVLVGPPALRQVLDDGRLEARRRAMPDTSPAPEPAA
ncbi:MAG TPA: hypothetical protein VGC80_17545, partial [Acetobacteraceae bacterium]